MSKLAEFRAAEEQLKAQLQLLESLKNDESLKREMEFESKLQELMQEYSKNLADIIAIIDPDFSKEPRGLVAHPEKAPRRARNAKRYKHPETAEVIETKGGNHKTLKAWKAEHGADVVEGWLERGSVLLSFGYLWLFCNQAEQEPLRERYAFKIY